MTMIDWWGGLQRQYRNVFVVALVDGLVLSLYLFRAPWSVTLWDWLTGRLPNFYDIFFLQFIALIRDASPGAVVASGPFTVIATIFLSLLTLHVLVALGIGFLFQKLNQTKPWSFMNYFVLCFVLFLLHLVIVIQRPLLT